MRIRPIAIAVLLGTLGALPVDPVLAAKHEKATGACAQPANRCVSDCDQLNWCTMYTCVNKQSTAVPLWRCFQPSGLCLAPHC